MNLSLEGKKAVITGGGKGLCREIAEAYYEAGAEIVLVGSTDKAIKTAKEIKTGSQSVHAVIGDLSKRDDIERIYEQSLEKLDGRIDILVNGAGVQYRSPIEDFPMEEWDKVMRINLEAVFRMSQLTGRTMLRQQYGKIINIASMTSYFGSVMIPAYTASKAGVAQLTKAFSNEWASRGINVNAIAPGYMATELTDTMREKNPAQYMEITNRIPMGRWGEAEDLKGISVFLASDLAAYISGAIIPVDGGFLGK